MKQSTLELIKNMDIEIGDLQQQLADSNTDYDNLFDMLMDEMSKTKEIATNLINTEEQLADMTEARDAVAAGAKWLRDKCTAQECVLNMIAAYGEDNPSWAARIAWAMVDDAEQRTAHHD